MTKEEKISHYAVLISSARHQQIRDILVEIFKLKLDEVEVSMTHGDIFIGNPGVNPEIIVQFTNRLEYSIRRYEDNRNLLRTGDLQVAATFIKEVSAEFLARGKPCQ